jgi:tRNA(Ile)-lysidine synthase
MKQKDCSLLIAVRRCLARLAAPHQAERAGIVAVSGGPDSVALLHALLMESMAPLVVAHLNHQLRGDESDADEAFVRNLHESLLASGARLLPLRCQRLDVRAAAAGENLESGARRLRYQWLEQVARETGAAWVATGHTADDQAETVLHRLLRGTGLRGLAGIPSQRELAVGVDLVRPLLKVRRQEVLAFLEEMGQPFCLDSTNEDRRFTRSRLRHNLLPLLSAQFNPAVVDVLCRLAEQAGESHAFVENHAKALLSTAELPRAGSMVVLDAHRIAVAEPLLAREALRLVWEREGLPLSEMGFETWQSVMEVVVGKRPAVDLPGGVHFRRVGNVVQVLQPTK